MGDATPPTKLLPLLTWRAAICDSGLSPTTRLVGWALSLYMSERGDSAYPGAVRLAHDTGLSDRRVRQHLGELVEQGWLTLVEKGGIRGERRRANSYRAVVPLTLVQGYETPTPDGPSPLTETTLTPDAASPQLSMNSPKPLAPVSRPRERDLLFEAVTDACGIDRSELNNLSRGPINRAVKALRESGATPVDVASRVGALRLRFPNAAITAPSLAKHWASLGNGRTPDAPQDTERLEQERVEFNELARREGWI